MIMNMLIKVLPTFAINTIRYFIKGNVRQYELLAENDDKPKAFVDGYVSQFDAPETKHFFNKVHSLLIKLIAPSSGNLSVLDVGCGTGRYLSAIQKEFPHIQLYGLDASENTIKNYTEKLVGIKCVCNDLSTNENPFANITFDLVYSITVIQYIPFYKINVFIARISALVNPGGRIVLQFPQSETSGFNLVSNLNYTRYSPIKICNILKAKGFLILESASLDSTIAESVHLYGHYIVALKM